MLAKRSGNSSSSRDIQQSSTRSSRSPEPKTCKTIIKNLIIIINIIVEAGYDCRAPCRLDEEKKKGKYYFGCKAMKGLNCDGVDDDQHLSLLLLLCCLKDAKPQLFPTLPTALSIVIMMMLRKKIVRKKI